MIMCSSAHNSTEYVTIFNLCGLFFLAYYTFFVCKKLCALNDMPAHNQNTLKKVKSHFPSLRPTHFKEGLRGSGNLRKIKPRRAGFAPIRVWSFLTCPHLCHSRNRSTSHTYVSFLIGITLLMSNLE